MEECSGQRDFVSSISIFFDREQPFLESFVNEQAFVADINSEDKSKAKSCSPLLVNAIYAYSAVGLSLVARVPPILTANVLSAHV